MSKVSTTKIFQYAKRFLSGTLISKCFGVVRDIAFAYAFGASGAIASFMVAFRLAHFFRRFIGESGLSVAFIPYFQRQKNISEEKAAFFFRDMLVYVFVTLSIGVVILSGIFQVSSSYLVGDWSHIARLTSILSLSLLFIGLYAMNQAYLQTYGSYFTASMAPVCFNIFCIIGALLAHKQSYMTPFFFLAMMALLGFVAQWFFTVPAMLKRLLPQLKGGLFKDFGQSRSLAKKVMTSGALGLLGIAAVQMNSVVDGLFAKLIDPSGPAYLWYAIRIYQLPLSLFAVSIASALLPTLSKVHENKTLFTEYLKDVCNKVVLFMVPTTFAILVLSTSGIELLYGRGQFGIESLAHTTQCLIGYGSGLIGSCFVIVLAQGFYAKGDYKTPSIAAMISVFSNLGLNAFFIFALGMGPASIALATGLSVTLNALVLMKKLKAALISNLDAAEASLNNTLKLTRPGHTFKVTVASAIAALTVLYLSMHLKQDVTWPILTGQTAGLQLANLSVQARTFGIKALLFFAQFIALAKLLRIAEFERLAPSKIEKS